MARKQKRNMEDPPIFLFVDFAEIEEEEELEEDDEEDIEDDNIEHQEIKVEQYVIAQKVGPEPKVVDERGEKIFSLRKKLNREVARYLAYNDAFRKAINGIRSDNKISILRYGTNKNAHLASLSQKTKDSLERDINNLIYTYRLPTAFCDWFEDWIFYDMIPNWVPTFNYEVLVDILENPERVKRVGLTTTEKNFVKSYFKKQWGNIKGRPLKQYERALKDIYAVLDASTNTRRSFRTIGSALAVKHNREIGHGEVDFDIDSKEQRQVRPYREVAERMYSKTESTKLKQQREWRTRKYMERLNKRMAIFLDK